jgi:hypothetical protein
MDSLMAKNVVGLHMGQIKDEHFRKMRLARSGD